MTRMLEVECGDMLEVLRSLPDACMDSCVTDPPYELSDGSKQSPCRVAAKVLLPDNSNAEAELSGECVLVFLALKIARLGGVDLGPGPTASMPIVPVTLYDQASNGQTQVEDRGPLTTNRIPNSDGMLNEKTEQIEYVGDFRFELADPETLVDALNCAGTGFFAGGIGIGFGIRDPLGPRLGSGRFVVDDGNADIWALYDSLPAGVGAGLGAKYESVTRLDVGGGSQETLSARAALVLLGVCQTAGAKLVRASTAACGLPPVLQSDRIRFVVRDTNRAFAFDIKLHTQSLTQTGFMSKAWDGSKIAFDVAAWREAYRVLKPGAYLAVFGGTRTWHRIAVAIEDAGFQIRDSLAWLYGQGFPKSMDLSKAIDKAAGAEREVIGTRRLQGNAGVSTKDKGGTYSVGSGLTADVQIPVTASATELAKKWEGWGTALKPSFEPIILARKPLIGTVAQNVEKYGVGGLHIDACRTPAEEGGRPKRVASGESVGYSYSPSGSRAVGETMEGRWPPNVCVDEDVAADLDELFGTHKAGKAVTSKGKGGKIFGSPGKPHPDGGYSDLGGVSRYFYCPKANSRERDSGLEHWPVLSGGDMTNRDDGAPGPTNPRSGAGRGGGRRNPHPTVKPLELMRWLVRLVTPPGGFIIDPFAGSGTTGCAAALEGFHFAGVELDPVHTRLAQDRIAYWASQAALAA